MVKRKRQVSVPRTRKTRAKRVADSRRSTKPPAAQRATARKTAAADDVPALLLGGGKRYRYIVETAHEGICIADASDRIQFVNGAFARLVGHAVEDLIGRPANEFLAADQRDGDRHTTARGDTTSGEQQLKRADGSTVWTSVSGNLLHHDDGTVAGILRMYTDITDHKELEVARERLVRHLVAAQEAERQRIARELHDQMGQHLVGLSLGLSRLKQLAGDSAEIRQISERLQGLADVIARDVQHLAFELRPASLDDLGLADAVSNYADGIAQRFGVEVDVQCHARTRLDTAIETTVYRIVQEALTNVVKHAQARHVSVILEPKGATLQVIVEDDGVGFSADNTLRSTDRLGLRGMVERAALVGGELQIESVAGRGTTLFLRVPLPPKERHHEEVASVTG